MNVTIAIHWLSQVMLFEELPRNRFQGAEAVCACGASRSDGDFPLLIKLIDFSRCHRDAIAGHGGNHDSDDRDGDEYHE